jgi:hypothetical protein
LQWFLSNMKYEICCSDMLVSFLGVIGQTHYSKFIGVDPVQFLIEGNCYTPMIMIKKNAFLKIGGFDETPKYQDHILMVKILENKMSICYFSKATFIHRIHFRDQITNKISVKGVEIKIEKEIALMSDCFLTSEDVRKIKFRQDLFRLYNMPKYSLSSIIFFNNVLLKSCFDVKTFITAYKTILFKYIPSYIHYMLVFLNFIFFNLK